MPPMQRHAVHRGGHAVLADAVVDEAAGVVGRRHRLHRLGAGVVGAGEVGRAADHLRHRRDDAFQRELAGGAGRDVLRLLGEAFLHRADGGVRARPAGRRVMRRSNSARLSAGSAARRLSHAARAALRALAGGAPLRQHLGGDLERRIAPAELLARALDLVGAERRAVRASPCRPWSARRSRWWSCRRSWSAGRMSLPCRSRRRSPAGSWPSIREAFQPAASKRFT